MKQLVFVIVLSWLTVVPTGADEAISGADDWYRDHYIPIWKENTWDKLEAVGSHYARTIYFHPREGSVEALDSRQWLDGLLQEWKLAGWLGSDVPAYQFDQLNPSTATFKTKWRSWYVDGSEDVECWWYMADARNDGSVVTQVAVIDCDDHGL